MEGWIIVSAPVPFLSLWTLDLGFGIWDLDLGLVLGLTIMMMMIIKGGGAASGDRDIRAARHLLDAGQCDQSHGE